MNSPHPTLPVHGYRAQSDDAVALVNANKVTEEQLLRLLDDMKEGRVLGGHFDQRWLSIARTHIEQGFMALNRAIFQPERLDLDDNQDRPSTPPPPKD